MFGKQNNSPPSIRVQFSNRRIGDNQILGGVEPLVARIERRPLPRLRNRTHTTFGRGFEDIDFRSRPTHERPVIVRRSRMFLARAGATRQPLTRKVRKVPQVEFVAGELRDVRHTVQGLVGNSSDIACVIGVRPLQKAVNQAWTRFRTSGSGGRTIPSKLAPYPALPRFPIAQTAGHNPATPFKPGNVTPTSKYPPVKQN